LEQLASREKRADLAKRLRTVLLASRDLRLRRSRPVPVSATVRCKTGWREGLNGLETRPSRGRKGPLTAEEAERFRWRIEAGALPEDGVCVLRGLDVQQILRQEFGKVCSLDSVYCLLYRLGFSSLVPRPRHPKAGSAAQEGFKMGSLDESVGAFR